MSTLFIGRPCEAGKEECVRVHWYTMSTQSWTPCQAREDDALSAHRYTMSKQRGTLCRVHDAYTVKEAV
jgi:hypothetical protein